MTHRMMTIAILIFALRLLDAASGAPVQGQQRAAIKPMPTAAELDFIRRGMSEAQPLTPSETSALADVPLPSSLDYSKYVTLIRKQGSGGCGTMATLSILDILKEKERPYSPDFSYRFAEYVYNLPGSGMDQMKVLRESGCCSEASLSSSYDPPGPIVPSTANYNEAKMYRIASSVKPKKPSSADELKKLLVKYGPLFAAGDTPGSAVHGHCFAIIGYDDNAQEFTIVNSFGDRWGTNGMMKMPYSNIKNPPANQTSPRVEWFSYAVNAPTGVFSHPYTARIRINTTTMRNHLTVKVGVEGQTPMVVWDRPNKNNALVIDDSMNLALDFPLPAYAGQHWPPSDKNQWYLEVTNDFPVPTTSPAGTIQEITLVKRVVQGNGQCIPMIYRSSGRDFPVPLGGTVKVYIPTKRHSELTLSATPATVAKGTATKFSGTLLLAHEMTNNNTQHSPQAGRDIEIRMTKREPIEGTVVYSTIGTAKTDSNGQFSLTYAPDATSDYQAFAKKPDTTVDAASNVVTVSVGGVPILKPMPKPMRLPR